MLSDAGRGCVATEQKTWNLLNAPARMCWLQWELRAKHTHEICVHLYRCSVCVCGCVCMLYKWQWNYLKPIPAFHRCIFLSAGWLTRLHMSQLSLTPHLNGHTHTHTHTHTHIHMHKTVLTPRSLQKMNKIDISLKVKLKMASIAPLRPPPHKHYVFVFTWLSI